jgi:hypothetical protein
MTHLKRRHRVLSCYKMARHPLCSVHLVHSERTHRCLTTKDRSSDLPQYLHPWNSSLYFFYAWHSLIELYEGGNEYEQYKERR